MKRKKNNSVDISRDKKSNMTRKNLDITKKGIYFKSETESLRVAS